MPNCRYLEFSFLSCVKPNIFRWMKEMYDFIEFDIALRVASGASIIVGKKYALCEMCKDETLNDHN